MEPGFAVLEGETGKEKEPTSGMDVSHSQGWVVRPSPGLESIQGEGGEGTVQLPRLNRTFLPSPPYQDASLEGPVV